MAGPRILFVTYGGGHVRMVIPVVRALQRRGGVAIDVLGLTTAFPMLAAQGIPAFGFSDLVTGGDAQALAWGRELAAGHASRLVTATETEAYLGLSFAELAQARGIDGARAELARLGRGAFLPVGVMQRAFARVQPDVVVATNSPRAEQAAILAARAAGIPALCMVDLFAIEEIKYVGQPGYADRICVLNEQVRDRFLAHGRNRDEIVVTGNPAFDALGHPEMASRGQSLRKRLGGDKVILFVSQPEPLRHRITGVPGDPQLPRHVQRAVEAARRAHPSWRLLVRPHPSEDPSAFSVGEGAELSPPGQPLAEVLHACDAVVCLNSTVGYEAALLGKPLVHVPLSIYWEEADYSGMGLALPVRDLSQMEMALNSVLTGRWTPPVRLARPGAAAEAVAAEILGLAARAARTPTR